MNSYIRAVCQEEPIPRKLEIVLAKTEKGMLSAWVSLLNSLLRKRRVRCKVDFSFLHNQKAHTIPLPIFYTFCMYRKFANSHTRGIGL
jgi:hypothetical protein